MTLPDVTWPQRTDRLLLRRVCEDDLDRLMEFRNKPEVYKWLLKTDITPTDFRAAWLRTLTESGDFSSVVELDGVVIGTASLEVCDGMGQNHDPEMADAEAEIGYILDPAYAGRGFGTEIARALLRISFEVLGVRRVTAGCYADNLASVRILEKIGMRREQHGVRDSWHSELGWIDGATYGLLVDEWTSGTTSAGAAPGR